MSAETQEYVDTLLLQFRDLVLGIQEEHEELKEKLSTFTNTFSPTTSSTTTARPTTVTASPTDDPSTHTISSGTLSTNTATSGSTRPPPYKSVVTLAPLPPVRTKRRSIPVTRNQRTTMSMSGRGGLIVLEGLDRVGKSTLAKKLVEHLERTRRSVSYFRFPDRSTPVGHLIDDFLKTTTKGIDDHTLHLLFSANRWELNKKIRNYLTRGTTVVIDRYSYSGIAYSSAKRGLSIEWCREPEKGLPKPDLVIYLELPKEEQYKRPGFGDERFETQELQELVRHQYEKLMDISQDTWLRIDVENKSPDQVLGEIIVPVKRCLEASATKEIGDIDFL